MKPGSRCDFILLPSKLVASTKLLKWLKLQRAFSGQKIGLSPEVRHWPGNKHCQFPELSLSTGKNTNNRIPFSSTLTFADVLIIALFSLAQLVLKKHDHTF